MRSDTVNVHHICKVAWLSEHMFSFIVALSYRSLNLLRSFLLEQCLYVSTVLDMLMVGVEAYMPDPLLVFEQCV